MELSGEISELSDFFASLSIESFVRGSSTLRPVSELIDLSIELLSPSTDDCLEQSGNSDRSLDGLIQFPLRISGRDPRFANWSLLASRRGEYSRSKL